MCEISAVTSASKPPVPVILVGLVSMAFWTLVIVGAVEQNDALAGTALGLGAVIAVFAITVAVRRTRTRRALRERIRDQGTLAKARIVSAKNDGAMNNDPYVDFVLQVQPEGGEPYLVACRTLVSQMAIPRVQPDTEIDVWVDPTNPQAVVIDPKFTS